MASIHSLDDRNMGDKPTINAEIVPHDTEYIVNTSNMSFTNLIDSAEYEDYLANYVSREDEIGDGLSSL